MKTNRLLRKTLSLLLSITLLLSLLPASAVFAWEPAPTVRIVKVSDSPIVFTFPSGSSMVTGFYRLGAGGNNEIAYCVDRQADGPVDVQYDLNDTGIANQQYLAGVQAIIQHGYPYTTNGLTDDEARYATQTAIHWLENYRLGDPEGWDVDLIDRTGDGGHPAALAWAKALYAIGQGGAVNTLFPRILITNISSSWTTVNGIPECTISVNETDTGYWDVTGVPAGITVVPGGNGMRFSGDVNLTVQMTDPAAYNAAASRQIQITAYSRNALSNIHIFTTGYGTQTMIAASGTERADPVSENLPEGFGELQIFKVTRTMDRGDVPEANATFVLYPTTYASYDAAVAAGAPTGTVTTDAAGFGTSTALPLGQYILHQTVAPAGTFPIADQTVTVKVYGANDPPESYFNEQGDGYVDVQKFTIVNNFPFPEVGAIFEVRNTTTNTVVDTLTTGTTGYDRSILLPYGSYSLVQTFSPVGTVIDTTVRNFTIGVDDSGNAAHADVVYFSINNAVSQGTVEIHKTTNYTVDVAEANAVFQVYPAQYADYATAIGAGAICSTITTDATGYARTGSLPYGTYTVHQSGWQPGLQPVADRNVTVGTVNGDNQVLNLVNETYWGDIEIQKYRATASDPDTRIQEPGAVFVVYPSSYANYAAALSGDPKAADTCDVITTGNDGIGRSTHPLPYGTYICEQISSAATADTFIVQPWLVTIGAQDDQHYTYERTNEIYEQYLRIVKTDADTGLAVPIAGATFRILAADLTTVLSDSNGQSSFVTDASGQIDLSDMPLLIGTYYIQETVAPVGYTLNPELIRFDVQMSDHGSNLVTVSMGKDIRTEEIANARQTCSLSVEKMGETLITAAKVDAKDAAGNPVTDGDGNALSVYDFYYDSRPMDGATFNVYAGDEDIVDEKGTVLYRANELIGSISTVPVSDPVDGTKYIASMDGLPLGADGTAQYVVTETKAPLGQLLSADPIVFDFTYGDQTIAEISQSKALENAKQDAQISVIKQKDAATWNNTTKAFEYPITGAQGVVFGLYTTNDLLSPTGTVIVKKDSLVDLLITGTDGRATSTKDLPFGEYYAKEIKVTEDLIWDKTTVYTVTVSPNADGTTQLVTVALNDGQPILNRTIKGKLDIYKLASDTDLPMSGVVFEIFDQKGNLVDTITTDKDGKANTKILPYGSYYVNEVATNHGYILGGTTDFTIYRQPLPGELYSDVDLTLYNDKMATISVFKATKDEVIPMDGVVFGIYDSATGKEISRLTTDATGNGSVYVTPGNYYLQEIETWPGYAVSPEKFEVKNAASAQIYHISVNNKPTSVLPKKTNPSGEPLAGCEFKITDLDGNVIKMYYDEKKVAYVALVSPKFTAPEGAKIVERAVSGKDGTLLILGLIAGKQYIITETKAPPGFNNDSTPQTITVPRTSDVLGTLRFVDTAITVKTGETEDLQLLVLKVVSVSAATLSIVGLMIVRRAKRKEEEQKS